MGKQDGACVVGWACMRCGEVRCGAIGLYWICGYLFATVLKALHLADSTSVASLYDPATSDTSLHAGPQHRNNPNQAVYCPQASEPTARSCKKHGPTGEGEP
jgi:hypothetical protein